MDAVKFFEESKRMCESFNGCRDCPLKNLGDYLYPCKLDEYVPENKEIDKIISIVEKWSSEHPVKTRQSEFLKMFPNASIDHDGALRIDPCFIDRKIAEEEVACNKFSGCRECRKNYWFEKIE